MARGKDNIRSVGMGDSKLTTTMDPEEIKALHATAQPGVTPRAHWTVEGNLVSEMVDGHAISWQMTDQHLAQCARKGQEKIDAGWPEELVRGRLKGNDALPPPLRAMFSKDQRDEVEKQIEQAADIMADPTFDPAAFDANPLDRIAARFKAPEMAQYWGRESDADMDRERGLRPVHNDKGEEVKFGEMRLLARPNRIRDMELRAIQARNDEQTATTIAADEKSQNEHFRRDLGLSNAPASVLNQGLGLRDDSSDFG